MMLHPSQQGAEHPIYQVRLSPDLALLVRWRADITGRKRPYLTDNTASYGMRATQNEMMWEVYDKTGAVVGYVERWGDVISEWVDAPVESFGKE